MKTLRIYVLLLFISVFLASCGQQKTKSDSSSSTETKVTTETKVQKHEHPVNNTPDDALSELRNGNKRFIEAKMENTDYKEQIQNTKADQHPHTIILSCIDSRVPPEILFDQGFGNIFVTRVAGNVGDENILGGMEFATQLKGSKLIVVMGHNKCGAVKGAIDNAELGNLTQLVDQIKPAIMGDKSNPDKMLDETSRNNVKLQMKYILEGSKVIAGLVKEGKVKIVGAYYDIETGKVEFFN
jgi:carbonic anhydrase